MSYDASTEINSAAVWNGLVDKYNATIEALNADIVADTTHRKYDSGVQWPHVPHCSAGDNETVFGGGVLRTTFTYDDQSPRTGIYADVAGRLSHFCAMQSVIFSSLLQRHLMGFLNGMNWDDVRVVLQCYPTQTWPDVTYLGNQTYGIRPTRKQPRFYGSINTSYASSGLPGTVSKWTDPESLASPAATYDGPTWPSAAAQSLVLVTSTYGWPSFSGGTAGYRCPNYEQAGQRAYLMLSDRSSGSAEGLNWALPGGEPYAYNGSVWARADNGPVDILTNISVGYNGLTQTFAVGHIGNYSKIGVATTQQFGSSDLMQRGDIMGPWLLADIDDVLNTGYISNTRRGADSSMVVL